MKLVPKFNFEKIRYSTDRATFQRAVGLYENKSITQFQELPGGFSAVVQGTKPYKVYVEARNFKLGNCECYLGQHGEVCKHIVALAIYALKRGEPLDAENKKTPGKPVCSGKRGTLDKNELASVKKGITSAMRYIKPYEGPSRIWFSYQNSLQEGCNRLSDIVSSIPVSDQTADILVNLLLRLDRKLSTGGVDDSNGIVGGFVEDVVSVLVEFAHTDPSCKNSFQKLVDAHTCWGWEHSLTSLLNEDE